MKTLSFILVSIRFVSYVAAERRWYGSNEYGSPSPQTEYDSTTPQLVTSTDWGYQSPAWSTAETPSTTSCTTTESVGLPLYFLRKLGAL
jgi:hypothetical protein